MNPLYLPLDALPGLVPAGAPVVWRGEDDWTVLAVGHDEALIVRHAGDDDICHGWEPLVDLALDLTAPPLDAQGHPTHIDGADVAAGMLARAMGHRNYPDGVGGAGFGGCYPGGWFVCGGDFTYFEAPGVDGMSKAIVIPALADINPDHPDAARLALAAIIRSKPWETR